MDPADEALLAAMEFSGVIPNSIDQQRRLDHLMADGLCYHETREAGGETYRMLART